MTALDIANKQNHLNNYTKLASLSYEGVMASSAFSLFVSIRVQQAHHIIPPREMCV